MPNDSINSVHNKRPKVFYLAILVAVVLVILVLPTLAYSFISIFPIDDGPYVGTQSLGVTLHWIFGTTLILTTSVSCVLNILLITYKKYKMAILMLLIPLFHILLISYAWSLMRV